MLICSKCPIRVCEETPYTTQCDLIRYGYKTAVVNNTKSIIEWAKANKDTDLKPIIEEWRAYHDSNFN